MASLTHKDLALAAVAMKKHASGGGGAGDAADDDRHAWHYVSIKPRVDAEAGGAAAADAAPPADYFWLHYAAGIAIFVAAYAWCARATEARRRRQVPRSLRSLRVSLTTS